MFRVRLLDTSVLKKARNNEAQVALNESITNSGMIENHMSCTNQEGRNTTRYGECIHVRKHTTARAIILQLGMIFSKSKDQRNDKISDGRCTCMESNLVHRSHNI